MEKNLLKFAVLGGDLRHTRLADLLAGDGHLVFTYALPKSELGAKVICADSLSRAMDGADCVVLPVPAFAAGGERLLTAPLDGSTRLSDIAALAEKGMVFAGGKLDGNAVSALEQHGASVVDYMEREDLACANATPTAEGAIQLAMEELPVTIDGLDVLLTGSGRVATVLAQKLKALGAHVTIAARSEAARAMAEALGFGSADSSAIAGIIGNFGLVINTVPALLLDRDALIKVAEGCLVLDLASRPGGVDFAAAAELGVRAIWALSLPGRVAPLSSAAIIRKVLYNILREEGKL